MEDAPISDALEAHLATHRPGLHVSLIEDSNAALLAELQRGSGESGESGESGSGQTVVLVALGGGVGTAVAIDGKIHRGARRGIEGGHAIVYPGGRKCACGQLGCLETYASGPSIARRADEILHEAPPGYEADGGWLTNGAMHPAVAGSKLARLSKIEARDVLEAAAAGDAVARASSTRRPTRLPSRVSTIAGWSTRT